MSQPSQYGDIPEIAEEVLPDNNIERILNAHLVFSQNDFLISIKTSPQFLQVKRVLSENFGVLRKLFNIQFFASVMRGVAEELEDSLKSDIYNHLNNNLKKESLPTELQEPFAEIVSAYQDVMKNYDAYLRSDEVGQTKSISSLYAQHCRMRQEISEIIEINGFEESDIKEADAIDKSIMILIGEERANKPQTSPRSIKSHSLGAASLAASSR